MAQETGRRTLIGLTLVALLWADPTSAYDFSSFTKTYQLHWPSLQNAGNWVQIAPRSQCRQTHEL